MNEVLKKLEELKQELATVQSNETDKKALSSRLINFAVRNVNRLEKLINRVDKVKQTEVKQAATLKSANDEAARLLKEKKSKDVKIKKVETVAKA